MSVIRISMFVFIIFHCIKEERVNAERTGLISKNKSRSRNSDVLNFRMTALSCHKKEKSCKRANIYRRLMTARRQCCKAEHRICLRKLFKICKNPKCLRRHNRKCINKKKRCNNGKVPLHKISCGLRRKYNPRKQTARKIPVRQPPNKKKLKERCHVDDDCDVGLCCAQHHRIKICKSLILEGQVCKKEFFTRKRSPEMFERCPCAGDLVCAAKNPRHNTCQAPS